MAANTSFSGTTDATLEFDRPIGQLNIGVDSGVTFAFSLDGVNFVPVPPGLYSIKIGPTSIVYVSASGGDWGVIGAQA